MLEPMLHIESKLDTERPGTDYIKSVPLPHHLAPASGRAAPRQASAKSAVWAHPQTPDESHAYRGLLRTESN